MPLSLTEALEGAAYRVILERTDPDGCVTHDKFAALCRTLDEITGWAQTVSSETRVAYLGAIPKVKDRAQKVLENNNRHHQLMAAYNSIAKP